MELTLAKKLEGIGLSQYESLLYAALAERSPASATYLAKHCGLSRSSVYTALNALIGKGLVGTTYHNDVKQFSAEDPEALEQLLASKQQTLKHQASILASLKPLLIGAKEPAMAIPNVSFFEGQEGLKRIYLAMLRGARAGDSFCILRDEFVWRPEWNFVFEDDWKQRVKRLRTEKSIRTQLLVNASAEEQRHLSYYRSRKALEMRQIPKQFSVDRFGLYILGETASILSLEHGHLIGIKITNRHLAANCHTVFQAFWKVAGKTTLKQ